jgi:hypothetical protein
MGGSGNERAWRGRGACIANDWIEIVEIVRAATGSKPSYAAKLVTGWGKEGGVSVAV